MASKLTSEQAKALVEKAKKSPLHGKHGKRKATLLKEEVFKQVQERILSRALKLTNAQTMLGLGTIRVFRIDGKYENFGKTRRLVKEKPKLVTDDEEIIRVLDWEYGTQEENPSYDDGDYSEFFFVETRDANNQAIDSQMNRVFGKATENVDVTSGGKAIAPAIVGMEIIYEKPSDNNDGTNANQN